MKKIRIGAIGAGIAFQEIHLPILKELKEKFMLCAIYSRTVSRAQEASNRVLDTCGYLPDVVATEAKLLERDDIDAVLIAVPIHLTAGLVRLALEVGKHVFAEKPLANSIEEGLQLVRLANKKKLILMVGENFRYQSRFRQLRELVEKGAIGESLLYGLNDLHYTYPNSKYHKPGSWRQTGLHQGGYLVDGGIHIVAGMREVVGKEIVEVHGLMTAFNSALMGGHDDTLLLHLRFQDNMIGQMALGASAIDPEARHPKIYGRDGTLVLYPDHIELWHVDQSRPTEKIPLLGTGAGFQEEWEDFYLALTTSSTLYGTPLNSLMDLQIILAGIESARTGVPVTIHPLSP